LSFFDTNIAPMPLPASFSPLSPPIAPLVDVYLTSDGVVVYLTSDEVVVVVILA